MADFKEVLSAIKAELVVGPAPGKIESVACHPSEVRGPHCLFVCINEYLEYNKWQTWRTHLESLQELKPAAVVLPEKIEGLGLTQVITGDPRRSLGNVSRLLYGYPDKDLKVYGITGTNGKTTTTRMLAHMLRNIGIQCASIGTLGIEMGDAFSERGTYTTPLAPQLYGQLDRCRTAGAEAVTMEVSSHGLALNRVEGISFDAAILTNIDRDHLDFHGTIEAYHQAKQLLFSRVRASGLCILNGESPACESFSKTASAECVTYGRAGSGTDLELMEYSLTKEGSTFQVCFRGRQWTCESRLLGLFQIENALAAITLLAAQGIPGEQIAASMRDFPSVSGRMEKLTLPNGATVIVDYAHNPDGLRNVLRNARLFCDGKLHVVFGCGGDRDKGKRPLMGSIAEALADVIWITSDNPRTEDPDLIIKDIQQGLAATTKGVQCDADRRNTIKQACRELGAQDVLVVAGKGHEDYQLVGYTKFPFSDQEVLREMGAR